jgi:hypothetical protein
MMMTVNWKNTELAPSRFAGKDYVKPMIDYKFQLEGDGVVL